MTDPLNRELELAAALKLTAPPPQAWIEAAALIPTTVGDLATLERIIESAGFRAQFASDPQRALEQAGVDCTPALLAAVADRLAV
ncbi:MAG TPA: hypothetical protein VII87_03345 [Solirubrobacteraceae bacterium]|jgi:hypothetical protein